MIYLDHHAASPLLPAAAAAMARVVAAPAASPSAAHAAGRAARAELEGARDRVAAAMGAASADVVFTSGGSEALALAIGGLAPGARRIVTSTLEHPAVLRALDRRARAGAEVVRARPDELPDRIEAGATLVVVQHANHETGEIMPVADIAARCRAHGAALVLDACQSLGKLAWDVGTLGATAIAVSASKIGGPAGAGALWVERSAGLEPLILGGAQERGRRAGTPGLVAIAGFGAAAAELDARLAAMPAVGARRDRLEAGLVALGAASNAPSRPRVATVTSVSFPGWRGPALVAALDLEGVCASSGAACSSGLDAPSPVLTAAFPLEPWRAASALRLSLGPETTDGDVESALGALARVVTRR